MKAIIIVMLVIQVASFLVTAIAIIGGRPRPDRGRPVGTGVATGSLVVAMASWQIADKHAGQLGADVLSTGAYILFGMALMGLLILIRLRRDTRTSS